MPRARAVRGPKALDDWRVSRVLLHDVRTAQAPGGATSLSHSAGLAVCAAVSPARPLGVDLERIRPRDALSLAEWVCSPAERETLAGLRGGEQLTRFYLLWTLKEAFIKAAKLDFPADMASIGLDTAGDLRAPPGRWRAASYRLGEEWICSVAWLASAGDPVRPAWRAVTDCVLPPVAILGEWMSPRA